MRFTTGALSLTLLTVVTSSPARFNAAGPHGRVQTHDMELFGRTAAPSATGGAKACQPGQWKCESEALSNCLHGAWNKLITCSGLTRCSDGTDGTPPGCVWKTTASLATSPSVSAAGPASSLVENHGCGDAEEISSFTLSLNQNNVLLPTAGGVVGPPSSSLLASPSVLSPVNTASTTQTGGLTSSSSISQPSRSGSPPTGGGPPAGFSAPHIVMYMEPGGHVNRTRLIFRTGRSDALAESGAAAAYQPCAAIILDDRSGNDSESEKQATRADYKANGIALMLSIFGGENYPTTLRADPAKTAKEVAQAVKENEFDGVDVNYEDTLIINQSGVDWVIAFQTELRKLLPAPYLISHAPQAPHFSPIEFPGGAYMSVHKAVGSSIDWYNIQYYNQGASMPFTDVKSIVESFKGMSVSELMAAGIPQEKIVIGKPVQADHMYNTGLASPSATSDQRLIDAATFAQIVAAAKAKGWNAGIMAWQWSAANAQKFMKTAWGS